MRMIRTLVVATLLALQGCVIPAAIDASKRWDSRSIVMERQMDASHFRIVLLTHHNRGEFDVLGGHGSHVVIRSIDVELWQLTLTDQGVEVKKEDSLSLTSSEDIEAWKFRIRGAIELDAARGRIALKQSMRSAVWNIPESELFLSDDKGPHVYGTIEGRRCRAALPEPLPPPRPPDMRSESRDYAANERGDHVMVTDYVGNTLVAASLVSACGSRSPQQLGPLPIEHIKGFSVDALGALKAVWGTRHNSSAASDGNWAYVALLYPGPESMAITEKELAVGQNLFDSYLLDEQARRFHWILVPSYQRQRFMFVTHDFVTGKTIRREFDLPQ
jgi:hypothetical protein